MLFTTGAPPCPPPPHTPRVAHTQLERMGGIVPFISYAYYHPGWHPVDDKARAVMDGLKAAAGTADLSALAPNSRAFVNTIGSSSDVTATAQAMTDYGITAANGAFFGAGVDTSDSPNWSGWPGSSTSVLPAFKVAAVAVQDPALAPYVNKTWTPLPLSALDGMQSVCYRSV